MSERPSRQVNLDAWKTKPDAAAMLGCSEKTIERYAEKGQLERRARLVPGRRPLPVFSPDDLERLQKESVQPAPAPLGAPSNQSLALRTRGDLASLLELFTRARDPAPPTKIFLTIEEAAAHTGLSEAYIRRKIRAAELPALRDRGWKIRRADLDKI